MYTKIFRVKHQDEPTQVLGKQSDKPHAGADITQLTGTATYKEASSKASLETERRKVEEAKRQFEDAIEDYLSSDDAAPEMESQRCEEASSKRDCPTDESGQDHLDTEGVGDNNTTTDHIIYFGIQAQAEGYVAERTSTRSVKEPNDGSTDDAPFSEDLTQGGEVLPTVRRERSDYNYKKQNNCNCTTTGASKSKSSRSKHTDNQHFRIGWDC